MHPTSLETKDRNREFSNEELISFLEPRRKSGGAWRKDKAAAADKWYCELTGAEPLPQNGDVEITMRHDIEPTNIVLRESEMPTRKERTRIPATNTKAETENVAPDANLTPPKNFLRSDGFTIVMLLIAIVAQTLHTATFFYFITPVPDSILRYVTAGVVGIGVDAAALVATIQSQRRWYLWAFALIHFGINMSAHFRFADNFGEIETGTIHFWFDSALLSGAVAFAVYCYSSVFAFKK